eukprot:CAMPEP_0174261262 /NCGR_PEP_ID=MMETSP0439-20130205/11331_1 /TAXON_ID=0 /ORGANISM="Stereomyxa ramosa, Strain Chinc5" /LENGTH=246 /DNA_ID=CAMNT_0015345715 /DNA_START=14 /DNA_END=754 /DNA_ORIENTATION=-
MITAKDMLFWLFLVGSVVYGFNVDRVHFIDHYTFPGSSVSNYLFRGGEPTYSNGSSTLFAWSLLNQTLTSVALKEAQIVLPSNYYFVDLSLLDIEVFDEFVEIDFFKENPSLGKYVWWPTIGALVNPNHLDEDVRKPLAESLNSWMIPDKIPDKMSMIKQLLTTEKGPSGRPIVYYIHCEAGEDRTGEMSGSYYMKWLNWTFHQALDYDNHVEDRKIKWESKNALQWYCYYLYYVENRDYDCTYEG